MALFTEERLRNRVQRELVKGFTDYPLGNYQSSKGKLIIEQTVNEQRTISQQSKTYDIFLSHSSDDADLVAGLKLEIEDIGLSVYVDWIEDPKLNRAHVTKQTALLLQERMKQCRSLIYAFSENASNSKWMPWELGFFDGIKGTVAVLPISARTKNDFKGTEYLGIYYYIQIDKTERGEFKLWVHETSSKYTLLDLWLNGNQPFQRDV